MVPCAQVVVDDRLGLVLDVDPRTMSQAGQLQKPPSAPSDNPKENEE